MPRNTPAIDFSIQGCVAVVLAVAVAAACRMPAAAAPTPHSAKAMRRTRPGVDARVAGRLGVAAHGVHPAPQRRPVEQEPDRPPR